jgi:hypothetical protein
MKSTLHIAAIDAALAIEDKLISPTAGQRDITVDPRGKINTWARDAVPAQRRPHIIGRYDARATVEMIAEDLLTVPAFIEAHS